jgi:sulfur carrier protein
MAGHDETAAVTFTLNGEARTFSPPPAHVAALVETLGLTGARVAVEVNRRIVRRADWAEAALADGDSIEVVHFVGGGS